MVCVILNYKMRCTVVTSRHLNVSCAMVMENYVRSMNKTFLVHKQSRNIRKKEQNMQ